MAGEADEPRLLALLITITVFRRLVFVHRRNRFQQRLRLLTVRNKSSRTEAYFVSFSEEYMPEKEGRVGSGKATILVQEYGFEPIRKCYFFLSLRAGRILQIL